METIYLVTGCCGLIGHSFCNWLNNSKKKKVKIIGIDDLSGSYEEHIPNNIEFHKFNLIETEKLKEIFQNNKIDYIYHFSAYAAEGLSSWIRNFNYTNNLICSTNLINCAIESQSVKRFIFTSSMAVYGNNKAPFDESYIPNPIDPYGIAKYAVEMDLQVASKQHNLEFCIIRPHNVYGVYQNIWDPYRNVLGIWMYKLLNNEPLTIYGDGQQKRAFTFIDDIMEPMYKASFDSRAKNEIINLGGIHEYTINEAARFLINIYQEQNKNKVEILYLEPRHEVKEAWSTWKKSIELIDFEHKTDLKTGLEKMWKWAKEQPKRQRKKFSEYEIKNGIYSYWK